MTAGALNLIKLAVGVDDLDHLRHLQAARAKANADAGLSPHPRHVTRMRPRRAKELLDGGCLYWVIKGQVRARQRILDLEERIGDDGVARVAIVLDPELIPTRPRAQRPFQGWRYLTADKAPPDARGAADGGGDGEELPADLARELDALGLL